MKSKIEEKEGIAVRDQRLVFARRQLKDDRTLAYYKVRKGAHLYLLSKLLGDYALRIDKKTFAPEHNYDFSDEKDDGLTFVRGGEVYKRPYGWKRFALNVVGKYSDDSWLGCGGIRTASTEGEWPVSYHGTEHSSAMSIAQKGYDLSKGTRFAYGSGVYTTPDINTAARYASPFPYNGKNYEIVLQNRVNPKTLKKINTHLQGEGEYWLSPNEEDVRPYGILIREV